jgi:oligo-1,6-glucosidase
MLTRWGNDSKEYASTASKMLSTFLLSMRGTPYYYFGDELGMSNIKFDKIEDYKDIETIGMYGQIKAKGGDLQRFLNGQKISARDNGRTPFQWDSTANAGFTAGTPWIKVNPNKATVNVAKENTDPNSVLNYFRKMVKLRKDYKDLLVYGKYTLLDANHPEIYAYTRTAGKEKVLVLLSFSKKASTFALGNLQVGDELINNLSPIKITNQTATLQPYQACIVKLK